MKRCFNVTGACDPQLHYMVNLQERLEKNKDFSRQRCIFYNQQGKTVWKNDHSYGFGGLLKKRLYCHIS